MQKIYISKSKRHSNNAPSLESLRFIVNYSKAYEVQTKKNGTRVAFYKN